MAFEFKALGVLRAWNFGSCGTLDQIRASSFELRLGQLREVAESLEKVRLCRNTELDLRFQAHGVSYTFVYNAIYRYIVNLLCLPLEGIRCRCLAAGDYGLKGN